MNRALWLALWLVFGAVQHTLADTVEFANGDTLSGSVVSLDAEQLVLRSDALGEVTVSRAKIAAVHFGERRPAVAVVPPREVEVKGDQQPAAAPDASADELIKQLRDGGLGAAEIEEVRKQFPLLNTPGAGNYFNQTLSGLIDGSVDVSDVRKDAIRARDGLMDIKKDLGPVGGALDGYLQILDNFIEETAPRDVKPAAPPK